ncbi:hypothetical protein BpHYR1_044306 [Brachionus plicatilis]|uniref:Uncharacterized protein n=1 Tax=Brachionus plicatilis TaxID=10195 RepID=A0A3M7SB72_BRAPC|nr:hypothetical protein BpHYR1_044306 [Brachionus plicatilis]
MYEQWRVSKSCQFRGSLSFDLAIIFLSIMRYWLTSNGGNISLFNNTKFDEACNQFVKCIARKT